MSDLSRVEEIFLGALEKHDPELCAAFLDEKCRGDAEFRQQVERLLQAHPRARQFLELPKSDEPRTAELRPAAERTGTIDRGPLQAAGADRRRGHGELCGWPSRPSRSTARSRSS